MDGPRQKTKQPRYISLKKPKTDIFNPFNDINIHTYSDKLRLIVFLTNLSSKFSKPGIKIQRNPDILKLNFQNRFFQIPHSSQEPLFHAEAIKLSSAVITL